MQRFFRSWRARVHRAVLLSFASFGIVAMSAGASDHLDSPSVAVNPRADIGDLYAWMSPDARRLQLVMTIVGHRFSDRVAYAFHLDSGRRFGATRDTVDLTCRFATATAIDCRLGDADRARGDASDPGGLVSEQGKFRVFAGRRDEPFFNNVRGTRAMYDRAAGFLAAGAGTDAAGCPRFDEAQAAALREAWRHTDGGPATNFLAGWTPSVLVVSIDVAAVTRGGALVAAWATTTGPTGPVDRAARPLTGNALLATLGGEDEQNTLKERWNRATPRDGARFVAELAKGVALYDGLDGRCGDGWLIGRDATPATRYRPLARLLADDRLWTDTSASRCTALFAVERAALGHERSLAHDCGGRTLGYDAVNVYRSLIAGGRETGIDDGVHADDAVHSATVFPFVAAAATTESGR